MVSRALITYLLLAKFKSGARGKKRQKMHKSSSKDNVEAKRPWSLRNGAVNGMISGRPHQQKPLRIQTSTSTYWNHSQIKTMWTVTHFKLENTVKILEFCHPSLEVFKCDWHYLYGHRNVPLPSKVIHQKFLMFNIQWFIIKCGQLRLYPSYWMDSLSWVIRKIKFLELLVGKTAIWFFSVIIFWSIFYSWDFFTKSYGSCSG